MKLHLDNTQSSQEWIQDIVRAAIEAKTDRHSTVHAIEHQISEGVELAFEAALCPNWSHSSGVPHFEDFNYPCALPLEDTFNMIKDVGSLWRVNWREIAENLIEDYEP